MSIDVSFFMVKFHELIPTMDKLVLPVSDLVWREGKLVD